MSTDSDRLSRREAAPLLLRLHRALSRLSGVLAVMNTGAHPDDEHSDMLAWFRYGLGHRIVIACSTRGEGGQNALGPERGGLLGLLRSREMEGAARVLDADVAWLGFGPDDPVHDFGFSKDGDATFARWGERRVIERMALAYRRWRPDVVIPTFLDVPGQHGHHRAMTRAAIEAVALAADPGALPGGGDPWRVTHLYLPAWSGAGSTYDDTVPPPPATLHITPAPAEPASGVSYPELGEWSRRHHATQDMGHWRDGPRRDWALHLTGGGPERRLAEALPATLAELAALAGAATPDLAQAAQAVAQAQAAFPDRAAILSALALADAALERAEPLMPPGFAQAHGHRLARKRRELAEALAVAAGIDPVVAVSPSRIAPGQTIGLTVLQSVVPETGPIVATPWLAGRPAAPLPVSGPRSATELTLPAGQPLPPQFADEFDALGGNGPLWLEIEAQVAGRAILIRRDSEVPLTIAPARVFGARPDAFVRRLDESGPLVATLTADAADGFDCPAGWGVTQEGRGLSILPPAAAAPGLVTITPRIGDAPALSAQEAGYPHTGPVTLFRPAAMRVLTVDTVLPAGARIAWIGSGDSTGQWLARLGADVTVLDPVAPDEDFAAYTTVMVGVVAFGNRPDLRAAVARLHGFVRRGGHLVTFYQRPDQGWDPARTPPLPLTIGTPSLRWRVTDPAAAVTILAPGHPLLTTPNHIGPEDFDGWDKERGLYFTAAADPAYARLLVMADPGEEPLTGSLVSAPVGAGRHSHVSLLLHHQLDRLVPGAFRLLANLAAPA